MKILLPIHSEQDAKLSLDFIANYRWLRGTQFQVLHVVGINEDEKAAAKAEESGRALVATMASKIATTVSGSEVITKVSLGQPVYEILQTASSWKATMIVMGFRKRYLNHQYLAGSVSRGVALQAPCSVSIIRPPEEYQTKMEDTSGLSTAELQSA